MSKDKGWWADSLVKWLGEMEMEILKGGDSHSGTANEQLMLQPIRSMLTSSQIAQLNAISLRVVGDLVRVVEDEFSWIKGEDLDLPWLDEFTAGLICLWIPQQADMDNAGWPIRRAGQFFQGQLWSSWAEDLEIIVLC